VHRGDPGESDWNATPGDDPETIKSQHETLNTTFGELVALGIEPSELEGLATPEEPRSAPLRVARSAREKPGATRTGIGRSSRRWSASGRA
jgi:hypothetical protein